MEVDFCLRCFQASPFQASADALPNFCVCIFLQSPSLEHGGILIFAVEPHKSGAIRLERRLTLLRSHKIPSSHT